MKANLSRGESSVPGYLERGIQRRKVWAIQKGVPERPISCGNGGNLMDVRTIRKSGTLEPKSRKGFGRTGTATVTKGGAKTGRRFSKNDGGGEGQRH